MTDQLTDVPKWFYIIYGKYNKKPVTVFEILILNITLRILKTIIKHVLYYNGIKNSNKKMCTYLLISLVLPIALVSNMLSVHDSPSIETRLQ